MEFGPDILAAAALALPRQLALWDLAPASTCELISVSENLTYRISPPDGPDRILRIHRNGYHSAAEIISEHAWIAALRQQGTVRTPAVLPMREGSTLARIELPGDPTPRFAALFETAPGKEPQPADTDLEHWFTRLGVLSARMHRQSETWRMPENFQRKRWTFSTTIGETPIWGSWRQAIGLAPKGVALLERCAALIATRLLHYGEDRGRFGLIHGDPRLANLLVDENGLWLIDFDDCGYSWFGYDLASAVSFFEHEPHVPSLLSAWMAGYRTERTWSSEDEAILPFLVMLRRMKLLGWVASHPEAPTAQAMGARYTEGALVMAERLLSTGTSPFER